jgi:hypothetical protein
MEEPSKVAQSSPEISNNKGRNINSRPSTPPHIDHNGTPRKSSPRSPSRGIECEPANVNYPRRRREHRIKAQGQPKIGSAKVPFTDIATAALAAILGLKRHSKQYTRDGYGSYTDSYTVYDSYDSYDSSDLEDERNPPRGRKNTKPTDIEQAFEALAAEMAKDFFADLRSSISKPVEDTGLGKATGGDSKLDPKADNE